MKKKTRKKKSIITHLFDKDAARLKKAIAKKQAATPRRVIVKSSRSTGKKWSQLKEAYAKSQQIIAELNEHGSKLRADYNRLQAKVVIQPRYGHFWQEIANNERLNQGAMSLASVTSVPVPLWIDKVINAAIKNGVLVDPTTGTLVSRPPRPEQTFQRCCAIEPFGMSQCTNRASYACMSGSRGVYCRDHAQPMISAGCPMHSL